MYTRVSSSLVAVFVFIGMLTVATVSVVSAQSPAGGDAHQQGTAAPAADPPPQHDMHHMKMSGDQMAAMPPNRDGSGTAWLPDDTPMYATHREAAGWMLMAHGNAFLQYLQDGGARGTEQLGSVNWVMGMADRSVAGGHLGFRGMVSLEPWTIRGCGYPDLLASGEVCEGTSIHDRQHPHDLFMELAATYDRPLVSGVRLQVYGGPAGEPALGPVAFPHRVSAMPNPLAPITHHWFDATHITYGVVTGGIYGRRWKAETSVFNGREPDEHRTNIGFAALDSWSGRLWLLPTKRWALQVSAGHLTEAEAGHDGGPRIDVDRVTASATYHHLFTPGTIWASTAAWGRNAEAAGPATNAFFAETNLTVHEQDSWFGRVELAQKSGHDLAIEADDVLTVAKLQAGYTRYFAAWHGWKPGLGGTVSAGLVPASLKSVYGSRINGGVGVFLTLRAGMPAM